jgi:hypothetical protein
MLFHLANFGTIPNMDSIWIRHWLPTAFFLCGLSSHPNLTLSPTAPYKVSHQLSTVSILRCRQLRALANSADQLLERFGL